MQGPFKDTYKGDFLTYFLGFLLICFVFFEVFSPTRLALGFLLFGREIVSGCSGIRRGAGSPSSCAPFPQQRPSSPIPQECQKCQRIALATSVSTRIVKKCLGDLSFHTSCQNMSWRPQFPPELSKKTLWRPQFSK